jgi:hypothetical protein
MVYVRHVNRFIDERIPMPEFLLDDAKIFDRTPDPILNLQALDLLPHDDFDFEPFGNSCTSSSVLGGTNCCNN